MSDDPTKKPGRKRRGYVRRLLGDVLHVARRDRKLWLVPLVIFIIVLGALMIAAAGAGSLAPFIYPLL